MKLFICLWFGLLLIDIELRLAFRLACVELPVAPNQPSRSATRAEKVVYKDFCLVQSVSGAVWLLFLPFHPIRRARAQISVPGLVSESARSQRESSAPSSPKAALLARRVRKRVRSEVPDASDLSYLAAGCFGTVGLTCHNERSAAVFHLTFTQPSVIFLAAASCRSETASERQ